MAETIQIPLRTILEVFKMLPEGTHAEVIDNSLFMSPATNILHRKICLALASQLFQFNQKKTIYEKAGVSEYWVMDSVSKQCYGFQLVNGKLIGLSIDEGTINSPLLKHTFKF
jgi:hypothetical protein